MQHGRRYGGDQSTTRSGDVTEPRGRGRTGRPTHRRPQNEKQKAEERKNKKKSPREKEGQIHFLVRPAETVRRSLDGRLIDGRSRLREKERERDREALYEEERASPWLPASLHQNGAASSLRQPAKKINKKEEKWEAKKKREKMWKKMVFF